MTSDPDAGAWRVEPDGAGRRDRDGPADAVPRRLSGRSSGVGRPASTRRGPSSHVAIGRTASAPSIGGRRAAAVATVSRQPGGTRPAATSASGASTNSRSAASRMGHDQEAVRLARIERQALRRPIERQPGAAEDQQVEVELARAPALALLAAERPLELLERDEQRDRAGRRIRARRHVEGRRPRSGTRGWSTTPTGARDVQPRHGVEADAGQGRERADRRRPASPAASPRFAPSPMYARTRRTVGRPPLARLAACLASPSVILHPRAGPDAGPLDAGLRGDPARRTPTATAAGFGDARRGRRIVDGDPRDGDSFGARVRRARQRAAAGRPRRPRLRAHPARHGRPIDGPSSTRPRPRAGSARSRTTATRPTSSRSPAPAVLDGLPDLAADNGAAALAGRGRGLRPSTTSATAGGSRSISTRRSTALLIAPGRRPLGRDRRRRRRDRSTSRLTGRRARSPRPARELLVAGRASADGSRLAGAHDGVADPGPDRGARVPDPAPPASARSARASGCSSIATGPRRFGARLAELGDAALVDSRVLLAHRFGADEAGWPRRRIASRPTCSCPSGSPTRGCGR